MIECDHGKLKRVINPGLRFKSIKTAHTTIKGIEEIRALSKGQAEYYYYGQSLGEVRLVNRAFGLCSILSGKTQLYGFICNSASHLGNFCSKSLLLVLLENNFKQITVNGQNLRKYNAQNP